MSNWSTEVYSPREIALAAGVPVERVVAALGRADVVVGHAEAVRIGRALVRGSNPHHAAVSTAPPAAAPDRMPAPLPVALFTTIGKRPTAGGSKGVSFA